MFAIQQPLPGGGARARVRHPGRLRRPDAADRGRPRGRWPSGRAATVPCNNDLLAANFIDDGERIWLIDYEYSGNNDACFELGNIWGECQPVRWTRWPS